MTDQINFSFTEKRVLADFPAKPANLKQVQSFFTEIDSYLNDHFGFREFFIYRYQREVRKRFGLIGNQTIVHQGNDGWLFLGQPEILFDFAGKNLLSDNELDSWIATYNQKRNWLKQQGIHYLLVAAPNKQSIYPEFVMANWKDVHGPGKLKILSEQAPEIAGRELVNLADLLIKHKGQGLIYYKSGTHWTKYGAYLAYLSMAEKIEQLLPGTLFKKDFRFTDPKPRTCEAGKKQNCGDLANMLLDFQPFEERFKRLKPYSFCAKNSAFPYALSSLPKESNRPALIKKCPDKTLKAVVFRDSFFTTLEPFFSENFSEVVYLWKPYDQKNMEEIIQNFKPDIVVEEIVERNIF